jgi:hypothetical protein
MPIVAQLAMKFSAIFKTFNIHYNFHNSLLLIPISSYLSPSYTVTLYFFNTGYRKCFYLRLGLQMYLFLQDFPIKITYSILIVLMVAI